MNLNEYIFMRKKITQDKFPLNNNIFPGKTALHYVTNKGELEKVQMLVQLGSAVDEKDLNYGERLFIFQVHQMLCNRKLLSFLTEYFK